MALEPPWRPAPPLPPEDFARVRRRTVFECCKWDPQIEDVPVLAPFPLVLEQAAWRELAGLSEALARETALAEAELLGRPGLLDALGLPRPVRAALCAQGEPSAAGVGRVIRFDFHWTVDGWRISEANTDVPGGYNEASGFTRLMAPHYPGAAPAGDPAGAIAEALAAAAPGGLVAFVHATAYADDRQVVQYLARRAAERGLRTALVAPDHLRWREGHARLDDERGALPVDALFRFFPAEWLPNLPGASSWGAFFRGARTPLMNPATAVLVQTKRFPVVWDRLGTHLPTWRRLLPETRARESFAAEPGPEWVLKPALGRVGEGVALEGVTPEQDLLKLRKEAARRPGEWVAQRRFEPVPFPADGRTHYPCVGVYTVGGRAAGAYGRCSRLGLTDARSLDAAVLVAADGREP